MLRFAPLATALALIALPALADADDDRALAAFAATFAEDCPDSLGEDGKLQPALERFEMTSQATWGDPSAVTVWQFRCAMGAYNITNVFLMKSDLNGLVPVSVPRPDLEIINEDPEDFESPVKEIRVIGWSATPFLVNPNIDTAKGELTEYSMWRGLGDAASVGTYRLVDEAFRLIRYDVDAAYDGEIDPKPVVAFE